MIFWRMNNDTKVTILLTVYKNTDFLIDCLQSIINQTHKNWELIIWDDCPEDSDSEIMIKNFLEKTNKKIDYLYIKNIKNLGIVWNLQNLLNHSDQESKFITILESDDVRKINYLEAKISASIQFWIDCIFSDFDVIDKDWKLIDKIFSQRHWFIKRMKPYEIILFDHKIFSYSNFFSSKESLLSVWWFVDNVGNNNMISDWDLYFRLLQKYNSYGIKEKIWKYRIHGNNFSMQKSWLVLQLWKNLKFYNFSKFYYFLFVLKNIFKIFYSIGTKSFKKIDFYRNISFILYW